MKLLISSFTTLIVTAASVHGGPAPVFTELPAGFWPSDVSADGTIVVGVLNAKQTVGRWTSANPGVVEDLGGTLTAGNACISEDGSVIYAEAMGLDGIKRASLWMGGTNWQNLPTMPGGDQCDSEHSSTWGMNGNGDVVVGLAWIPGCGAHGYRWDAVNGMVDLGSTVPGNSSRANVVNADGSMIAGWQDTDNGRSGAIWTNGVQSLVMYNGHEVGEAMAISPNGQFVAGTGDGESNGGWLLNRGTDTTISLPNLDPKNFFATALATAVNNDGSIAIGTTGGFPFDRKAVIWTDGVPQDLLTYLVSQGTTGLEQYISLCTPMGGNENLTAVVGFGFVFAGSPPAWLVTFPGVQPCPADVTGDGTVDMSDLLAVIAAWGATSGPADVNGDGIVNITDLLAVIGAWGACPG